MTISQKAKTYSFHDRFLLDTLANAGIASGGTGGTITLVEDKLRISVAASAGNEGFAHFTRAIFDIDRIAGIEFDAHITALDGDATIWLGLTDDVTFAGAPTTFAHVAAFHTGGTDGKDWKVYSDDAVVLNNDIDAGVRVELGKWQRYRIDFVSGNQGIVPPGTSLGGKSALQFGIGDVNQHVKPVRLNQFVAMTNTTGSLTPFAYVDHDGAGGSAKVLDIKDICIDFNLFDAAA